MNGQSVDQVAPLTSKAVKRAAKLLGVDQDRIVDLEPLPVGMTNSSFTFRLDGKAYVLRLPGLGTEQLINRKEERAAYRALRHTDLPDEVVALDKKGRRVTVFYEDARVADASLDSDLAVSMGLARELHELRLPLEHRFAFGGQVKRYERLCQTVTPAPYPALDRQQARTAALLRFRRKLGAKEIFCHCDLASDNVLILPDGSAKLIDWEYSGRADPIMDVAMFCMYSFLERDRIELALRYYLQREPTAAESARLYLYLALAGYLWGLWAHYKCEMGEDYGDYGPRTYAYALEYYPVLATGDLMERALDEARGGASPPAAAFMTGPAPASAPQPVAAPAPLAEEGARP
jgi:thiamine kinase-like enzyme